MTIEDTIYSRLSNYAGLTALVSDRVYPKLKPQDSALPAVTFGRISSTRFSAMGEDADVVKARFQFDVWADSYESAVAVKNQVRQALQRWRTTSGTTVQDTFIITEIDLFEDDPEQYHIAIDAEINYVE